MFPYRRYALIDPGRVNSENNTFQQHYQVSTFVCITKPLVLLMALLFIIRARLKLAKKLLRNKIFGGLQISSSRS